MKLAYIKTSHVDQDMSRQREALGKAGCENGYQDAAGPKRPRLQQCLRTLQAGDVLVIWRLDDLAANLSGVMQIVDELNKRKIQLLSLCEPLNTGAPDGGWIYRTFTAMRQCERSLLKERCKHGMKAARARGIKLGARPKLTSAQIAQAQALIAEGQSMINIADFLKVSRSTLYRALQREALSVAEIVG